MAATQWKGYADKLVAGTGGWTHHFATNTFGASGVYNGEYTEAAAWNCTHIRQHYLYTQDRQFLADFFDTLYGAARFYFGYLRDTDGDGLLEIPNNYSPELAGGTSVAVHAQQLVYQHLCNTRNAAVILGKTAEAANCQSYIDRMYNGIDIVNGEQCEWKGALTSEPTHRHLSHLMCLYPLGRYRPMTATPLTSMAPTRPCSSAPIPTAVKTPHGTQHGKCAATPARSKETSPCVSSPTEWLNV